MTIFGESFGCLFLATVRNVKKFLAVARHGQTKMFSNMLNIYRVYHKCCRVVENEIKHRIVNQLSWLFINVISITF